MLKGKLTLFVITLAAFGGSIAARAADSEKFSLIHVADLTTMLNDANAKPAIFDANNEKTRRESGIIPGAKLLVSSKGYNVAKTLPSSKDTQLVFYCANPQCMSSHAAAEKAVNAGYTKVSVLSDGIQGWIKAGQKVEKFD